MLSPVTAAACSTAPRAARGSQVDQVVETGPDDEPCGCLTALHPRRTPQGPRAAGAHPAAARDEKADVQPPTTRLEHPLDQLRDLPARLLPASVRGAPG